MADNICTVPLDDQDRMASGCTSVSALKELFNMQLISQITFGNHYGRCNKEDLDRQDRLASASKQSIANLPDEKAISFSVEGKGLKVKNCASASRSDSRGARSFPALRGSGAAVFHYPTGWFQMGEDFPDILNFLFAAMERGEELSFENKGTQYPKPSKNEYILALINKFLPMLDDATATALRDTLLARLPVPVVVQEEVKTSKRKAA